MLVALIYDTTFFFFIGTACIMGSAYVKVPLESAVAESRKGTPQLRGALHGPRIQTP